MNQMGPTHNAWLLPALIHFPDDHMTNLFLVKWIFTFFPILTMLVLMTFKNCSGPRAGAAGWFVAFDNRNPCLRSTPETSGLLPNDIYPCRMD